MIECIFHVPQVGGSIHGELLCSITIPSSTGNVGLACSSDGALLAVSNFETKRVCVLTTDPATVLYTFGGPGDLPGQFNEPCKVSWNRVVILLTPVVCSLHGIPTELLCSQLCFAPNGNILVCEDINQRVQEVTISGVHVRFIGADILVGDVWAVDVSPSGDRLVVGVFNDPLDTTDQVGETLVLVYTS